MKKGICFVGFTEAEVRALRPSLGQVESIWECIFCPDGATAQARMEKTEFAAVVVDLHLADMTGAELLQIAALQHPHALRFVLGTVADRELVVDAIGAPYQFVSRPWDLVELVSVIERSLSLDAWLSNDNLRALVPQLGRLPGLPSTYFEVVKRAECPTSSVERIGEVIARDPALTARLLQTVNSAAHGLAHQITSPVEAVGILGLETVKSLVLCLQVFNQPALVKEAIISLDDLWRYSLAVAQVARKVTLQQTDNVDMASEAFTAGLLHRVGQIILATNLPEEYATTLSLARENRQSLQDTEVARFGVTSDQIGAYLLGLWGMPLPLLEAVALCHTPSRTTAREFSILTAVHITDVLTAADQDLCPGVPAAKLDRDYLEALGLPWKVEAWRQRLAGDQPVQPAPKADPSETASRSRGRRDARQQLNRPIGQVVIASAAVLSLGVLGLLGFTPFEIAKTRLKAMDASRAEADFDSVKLQGIFYRAGQPVAVINGRTLACGEVVDGMEVVSIHPASVVLAWGGKRQTIKLK